MDPIGERGEDDCVRVDCRRAQCHDAIGMERGLQVSLESLGCRSLWKPRAERDVVQERDYGSEPSGRALDARRRAADWTQGGEESAIAKAEDNLSSVGRRSDVEEIG